MTWREPLAAAACAAMIVYVVIFSRITNRFTNDWLVGPFGIEWLELFPLAGYLVAGVTAFRRQTRVAAVALLFGLIAFFVVHFRYMFEVPLGFLLLCAATGLTLWIMPPDHQQP